MFFYFFLVIAFYFLFRLIFVNGKKGVLTDLTGKVIIVTGSSDGIGVETAKYLAKQGAHVILACRSPEKTLKVIDLIQKDVKDAKLTFIKLDLSDLDSVKSFVDEFHKKNLPLDILVNNAATVIYSDQEYKTKQGYEMMFGVNYLGHFLLTKVRMIYELIT